MSSHTATTLSAIAAESKAVRERDVAEKTRVCSAELHQTVQAMFKPNGPLEQAARQEKNTFHASYSTLTSLKCTSLDEKIVREYVQQRPVVAGVQLKQQHGIVFTWPSPLDS